MDDLIEQFITSNLSAIAESYVAEIVSPSNHDVAMMLSMNLYAKTDRKITLICLSDEEAISIANNINTNYSEYIKAFHVDGPTKRTDGVFCISRENFILNSEMLGENLSPQTGYHIFTNSETYTDEFLFIRYIFNSSKEESENELTQYIFIHNNELNKTLLDGIDTELFEMNINAPKVNMVNKKIKNAKLLSSSIVEEIERHRNSESNLVVFVPNELYANRILKENSNTSFVTYENYDSFTMLEGYTIFVTYKQSLYASISNISTIIDSGLIETQAESFIGIETYELDSINRQEMKSRSMMLYDSKSRKYIHFGDVSSEKHLLRPNLLRLLFLNPNLKYVVEKNGREKTKDEIRMYEFSEENINVYRNFHRLGARLFTILNEWLYEDLPPFPLLLFFSLIIKYSNGLFVLPKFLKNKTQKENVEIINKYKEKHYRRFEGVSELETSMNILRLLFEETDCLQKGDLGVTLWCDKNKINKYVVTNILNTLKEFIPKMTNINKEVVIGNFSVRNFVNIFQRMFIKHANDKILRKVGNTYDFLGNPVTFNRFSNYNSFIQDRIRFGGILSMKNGKILLFVDLPDNTVIRGITQKINREKREKRESVKYNKYSYTEDVMLWAMSQNDTKDKSSEWLNNFHVRQAISNSQKYDNWKFGMLDRSLKESDRKLILEDRTKKLKYKDKRANEIITVDYRVMRRYILSLMEFLIDNINASRTLVVIDSVLKKEYFYYNIISDLFPQFRIHYYTNGKNIMPLSNAILKYSPFSKEIASKYKRSKSLFYCDIRNVGEDSIGNEIDMDNDESLRYSAFKQKEYVQSMQPSCCSLKYQLPYASGNSTYFGGVLKYPIWSAPTSTEFRIQTCNPSKETLYSHGDMGDFMYWHNTRQRTYHYKQNEEFLFDRYDHCYDCSAEIHIIKKYLKVYSRDVTAENVRQVSDLIQVASGVHDKKYLNSYVDFLNLNENGIPANLALRDKILSYSAEHSNELLFTELFHSSKE